MVDNSGDLSQVVAEIDTDGSLKSSYTRCDDLISVEGKEDIWYYVFDGHGSVRMLTDSAGEVTDSYSYDAYGNLMEKEGDTENDYLYVGEQYNANTGLYYLRARYMNPSTGTFTTMDSYQGNIYEPASLHKYMYANTNPVMNTDPSGYCSMPELCVGMTALEVLKASIKFIIINTLVGGFVGGILGGIDAALGGAGTKEIWKEALMGLGIGLALGAAISTLMCFSVIFPILQVAVQVFRVVLFTLGMVGALVSYQEGNTAQAIFRALLSLFSFVMLGKQIKGFEQIRLKGNGGDGNTLYHYTNEKGLKGIVESQELRPSLKANNPKDARYGDGQYLSDITPDGYTPAQLAKKFINVPNRYKFTHYIEIDVTGLNVVQGRSGVYVIPNETPLNLLGRIVSTGEVCAK